MTREEREEAIYQLERCIHNAKVSGNKYSHFELAIEALKAEPCEDAIRRQAVLDYIHRILNQGTGKKKSFEFIQKYVEKLPSVNPQEPKTGDEWVDDVVENMKGETSHTIIPQEEMDALLSGLGDMYEWATW